LTTAEKLVELHKSGVFRSGDARGERGILMARLSAASGKEHSVIPMPPCPTVTEPETAKKCRILIVDDNKDLATSLARLLGLLGHEVEVVFDGRQGIEAVRTYRPRVLLLDIGLPHSDGYQVARTLRQEGFHDLLIIALSGYGQEEDRRRSQEAGMNHHVTKPVDVKTIVDLIARSS
jgi:CheY-like chemotaxis protein